MKDGNWLQQKRQECTHHVSDAKVMEMIEITAKKPCYIKSLTKIKWREMIYNPNREAL